MTGPDVLIGERAKESDEELFESYRGGEESGFEALVDRYRGPLFTVIYRMLGDRGLAEDLFQETFFRVVRNRDRFEPGSRFSPWLYAIAVNLVRDHLRSKKRSPLVLVDEPPDCPAPHNPESDLYWTEVRQVVANALAALPQDQREVFLLREQAGLSFKEIAHLTGANLNTVLGRMHLAMKKLQAEFSSHEEKEA
jgi:RNA polymerase sigma-70 factor, ECF subfamily